MAIAFAPAVVSLMKTWFYSHEEMSHGFLAPLVAGYIVYLKRNSLVQIERAPNVWGLLLLVWAGVQFTISLLAHWVFLSQTALLLSAIGAILYLRGTETLKRLAFPLFVLALMIPPPSFLYARFTLALQMLASILGELTLEALGYSVLREGNILELVGERLSVVEACSGIRSMATLFFFFAVYGYFFLGSVPVRMLLLIATVPAAILGNAARITLTGVVGRYDRELAHGVLHEASGYVVLLIAAAACIGFVQWVDGARRKAKVGATPAN